MDNEIDEIGEILDYAQSEWDLAKDNKKYEKYESAEKLFQLAIKKTKEIYPEIHARLSWLYMDMSLHSRQLGDDKNFYLRKQAAEEQAGLAIKHAPENITAHFVKTWIYMTDVLKDGKLFFAGSFNKQVVKLVQLYQELVLKNQLDAEDTLFWGEKIMVFTDFIKMKNLDGENEIYSAISKISVKDLDYSNVEPDKCEDLKKSIRSMVFKAESQLL